MIALGPGGRVMRGTLLATMACAIAACTGTAVANSSATSANSASNTGAHPSAAWPEFNADSARTGVATGLPAAGKLSINWRARLDGAVYGQPLVVGDDVIAATENDSVYALDKSTGGVVWREHLGTPVPRSALHGCGDIFPLGITGTPVYDQADGLVYAVADTAGYHFTLYGLSVRDGAVRVDRAIGLATKLNNPAYDQQRPGLTLDHGMVYAAFGGLAGDCGTYVGSVAGIPASGTGGQVTLFTPTTREGAVWGTAGPVTGPHGDLWIAIGNGAATRDAYDGSDSVTMLTPGLKRAGFFAPATWAGDNADDLDLGSTQPALAAGNSTLIVGKRGEAYLLDTTSLGGIGGERAEQVVCAAFGAAAVNGSTVYEPCRGGVAAISVNEAKRQIKVLWRGPSATNGSPVLGGGALWVTAYSKGGDGTLYELNPDDGAARYAIPLGAVLPHFSSLSLAGGIAYVSTLDGVTAVSGA